VQGRDPMILTLARGHYCPKEHQQHLELAGDHAPFHGWDRRPDEPLPRRVEHGRETTHA
jgi:hypothetical protein